MGYEWALACYTNIEKVGLKLVDNAEEVGVDRLRVDVGGLESDKEVRVHWVGSMSRLWSLLVQNVRYELSTNE